MSDLWELYMEVVHWAGRSADRVIDGLGLEGGLLDRLVSWLAFEADVVVAALLATLVLALWTMTTAGLASWLDRRVRAWTEGRRGPRHTGPGGVLQGLADWVKLMLRRREGAPSALSSAASGALVLGALAVLPLGPWARLADPSWGLLASAGLLALSAVPMAAMAPRGRRLYEAAESAGMGAVLLLSVASVVVIGGSASAGGHVTHQQDVAWGALLAPLGFLLYMLVMYWQAVRLHRVRATSRRREDWPAPSRALDRYARAAAYYGMGALGAVVFLGGWSGPGPDGLWWTLSKAFALLALSSLAAGVMPVPRPRETASSIRRHWLPLAALNLVVVAAILEVVA